MPQSHPPSVIITLPKIWPLDGIRLLSPPMINTVYPLASCDAKTVGADTPAASLASRILEHLAGLFSHTAHRVISDAS